MAKQATGLGAKASRYATFYNFLLNEVLASQLADNYEFWIVAPWVKDFPLEKPYHVSFQEVIETKQESLHLFDVLHQMAANGGKVYITVGSDQESYSSLQQLCNRSQNIQVRVFRSGNTRLHTKAYTGRYGAMDGSANLTYSGIHQNIELLTYKYDPRSIAELYQICKQHFEQAEEL
jgi:hypothetical protein